MDPRAEAKEAEKAAQSFSHIVEEFAHALNLVNELVSTDPCKVDEWGTCVPHGHLGVRKLECPHAKARRMLSEYDKFWLN
jgi:hypothetical protein